VVRAGPSESGGLPIRSRRDLLRMMVAAAAGGSLGRAAACAAAFRDALDADSDVVGEIRVRFTKPDDTLFDIARNNNLGTLELVAANPEVDRWLPGEGTPIVLPTAFILPRAPRRGIVINVGEMRLYYFDRGEDTVFSFPIGIGRKDYRIPLGSTTVVRKQKDPSWIPTASARADNPALPTVIPPGPNNPMGRHALYLGWPTYAVHGTNNPWSVGHRVSRGCIRLYPEGIETLFGLVETGTPVTVVDQPAKLGWLNGLLHLEIHPSIRQFDRLDADGKFAPEPFPGLDAMIAIVAGGKAALIDWAVVRQAERERRGYPMALFGPADLNRSRDP
jgi:L,D-transpeptidase ErfK/SrfK